MIEDILIENISKGFECTDESFIREIAKAKFVIDQIPSVFMKHFKKNVEEVLKKSKKSIWQKFWSSVSPSEKDRFGYLGALGRIHEALDNDPDFKEIIIFCEASYAKENNLLTESEIDGLLVYRIPQQEVQEFTRKLKNIYIELQELYFKSKSAPTLINKTKNLARFINYGGKHGGGFEGNIYRLLHDITGKMHDSADERSVSGPLSWVKKGWDWLTKNKKDYASKYDPIKNYGGLGVSEDFKYEFKRLDKSPVKNASALYNSLRSALFSTFEPLLNNKDFRVINHNIIKCLYFKILEIQDSQKPPVVIKPTLPKNFDPFNPSRSSYSYFNIKPNAASTPTSTASSAPSGVPTSAASSAPSGAPSGANFTASNIAKDLDPFTTSSTGANVNIPLVNKPSPVKTKISPLDTSASPAKTSVLPVKEPSAAPRREDLLADLDFN